MAQTQHWMYRGILSHHYLKSGKKGDDKYHYGLDSKLENKNNRDYIIVCHEGPKFLDPRTNTKRSGRSFGMDDKARILSEHVKIHMDGKPMPSLYETTLEGPQKFKLDIDFNREDHPELIDDDDFVEAFPADVVWCLSFLKYDKCMVFTSHCPDGKKLSWHIVVTGVYVNSSSQAKLVYNKFIEIFKDEFPHHVEDIEGEGGTLRATIDDSVYKPVQQFRMLWSSKRDSERPKIFSHFYKIEGDSIRRFGPEEFNDSYIDPWETESNTRQRVFENYRRIFEASLISCTEQYWPCYTIKEDKVVNNNEYIDNGWEVRKDDSNKILKMINDCDKIPSNFFKIDIKNGPFISYNHGAPGGYYCRQCSRRHDNERPYTYTVSEGKFPTFFDCRRGGKKLFIGNLIEDGTVNSKEEEEDDSHIIPVFNPTEFVPSPAPQAINTSLPIITQLQGFTPQPVIKLPTPTDIYQAVNYVPTVVIIHPVKTRAQIKAEKEADAKAKAEKARKGRFFLAQKYIDTTEVEVDEVCTGRYIKPYTYEEGGTLGVKAPMDSGKTHGLIKLLKDHPNMTSLIITPRRSLARDIHAKLTSSGLTVINYLSDQNPKIIRARCLIILPESLHRCGIMPDVLIVDEAETNRKNFVIGNHGHYLLDHQQIYKQMLKHAKYALFMDAGLTSISTDFIKKYRPNLKVSVLDRKVHHNIRKIVNYYPYICRDLINKLKLVFACDTVPECEKIYGFISALSRERGLNLRIKLITSNETDDPAFFEDVNIEAAKYDVLIHTSALGPGVSIDVVHFDRLYIFTTNKPRTATVPDMLQMTGRVRNYRLNDFYLVEKMTRISAHLPLTVTELYEAACHNRVAGDQVATLTKTKWTPSANNLEMVQGRKRVMGPWKELYAEVIVEQNISRVCYSELFQLMCEEKGYTVFDAQDETFDSNMDQLVKTCEELGSGLMKDRKQDTTSRVTCHVSVSEAEKAVKSGNAKDYQKQLVQVKYMERKFSPDSVTEFDPDKDDPDYDEPDDFITGMFGFEVDPNAPKVHKILRNIQRLREPIDKVVTHDRWCRKNSNDINKHSIIHQFIMLSKIILTGLGISGTEYGVEIEKDRWDMLLLFFRQRHSLIADQFGMRSSRGAVDQNGWITDESATKMIKSILNNHLGINLIGKRKEKTIKGVRSRFITYTVQTAKLIEKYVPELDMLVPYKYHHCFYYDEAENDPDFFGDLGVLSLEEILKRLDS